MLQQQGQTSTETEDENSPSFRPPPPAFPHETDATEDSGGERDIPYQGANSDSSEYLSFFSRNPHLRLGNVLRKSKSLMAKLAEQRRKLRHVGSIGSNGSWIKRKSKSPSSLGTTSAGEEEEDQLVDRKKGNSVKNKIVKISESSNTYHPSSQEEFTNESTGKVKSGNKSKKKEWLGGKGALDTIVGKASRSLDRFRNGSKVDKRKGEFKSRSKGERSSGKVYGKSRRDKEWMGGKGVVGKILGKSNSSINRFRESSKERIKDAVQTMEKKLMGTKKSKKR